MQFHFKDIVNILLEHKYGKITTVTLFIDNELVTLPYKGLDEHRYLIFVGEKYEVQINEQYALSLLCRLHGVAVYRANSGYYLDTLGDKPLMFVYKRS